MTETIQQLKEDIAILQEKLNKLEEAEKEPDMMLMRQGKVDIVDYDTKTYYRIEYTDSFSGSYVWFVRRRGEDYIRQVRDVNVYGVLEDYYQKQVMKQIEEYPYKKYTPEETAESLRDAMRQAKKDGVFDVVDEPDWYDEVEWDEKDNPTSYITDEVVNRLVKKYQAQGVKAIATLPTATKNHWEIDFTRPTLILLGNEGAGLSPQLATLADETVKIPLFGGVESLNVATATAVILYEARRQLSVNS